MSKINYCVGYGLAGVMAGAIGVLAMSAFAQSRPQQYKVVAFEVRIDPARELESNLNDHAAQGWRAHTVISQGFTRLVVFERK
jgi:hypothetical protein